VTTGITPEVWACIGDSLTQNNPSTLTGTKHTWVSRIDIELFPTRAAANLGKNSDVLSQMRSRYDSRIVGYGYYGIVLWGGVNDILADATGAATFAAFKSFVDDALSRGMKVIAIITPPAGSYSGWSAGRQTQLEAFRTLMLATFVDGYHADFVGLLDYYDLAGDDADPTVLADEYEMAIPDGLHTGEAMQDDIILPTLVPLMAAEAETVVTSSLELFGVTYSAVRAHCFPRLDDFSTTTSPSAATVSSKIEVAASRLAAGLAKEEITTASIAALGSAEPAYIICADIIRKLTALSLRIPADDPSVPEGWQKEVDAFFTQLDADAGLALANDSLGPSESDPDGPTHHIDEYSLSIGDTTDASSAAPALRKDDAL
jgi:hypothetical protein